MAHSELAFFENLPRSRSAAGALLFDRAGRVLVVDPVYKPGWSLPGGVVEQGESPLAACRRECAEELGFAPVLRGLVCVDWLPAHLHPDGRGATLFVFAGDMPVQGCQAVRLPPEELGDARLIDPAEAEGYLPADAARRVGQAVAAARQGATVYLEHGRAVQWDR